MDRILIVDGNSILNRAFFAIKGMTNSKGFPTGALFGFMNTFEMVQNQLDCKYFAFCFDMKGGTFRNEMYKEYKATRKGMDPDLAAQLPVLKKMLGAMGFKIVELQGFEADDLIGTLAHRFSEGEVEAYILTGDRDSLQLVGDGRYVYYHGTKNKIIYDEKKVLEDMGVEPARICDLKGLMGDSSDNIPGVKGVGPKTALKLLADFGTLENLILGADKIENQRLQNLIKEEADMAVLSKKLAQIETHIPLDFEFDEFLPKEVNEAELLSLLNEYELKRLKTRMHEKIASEMGKIEEHGYLMRDFQAELELYQPREAIYITVLADDFIPIDGDFDYISLFQRGRKPIFCAKQEAEPILTWLKNASETGVLKLKAKRLKEVMLLLEARGIHNYEAVFDLSILAYLLDPNRAKHLLSELTESYLNKTLPKLEEVFDPQKKTLSLKQAGKEELALITSSEFKALEELEPVMLKDLEEKGMTKLYYELELPLSKVLVTMQKSGFRVDKEELRRIDEELASTLEGLEQQIYFMAGEEFNINSTQQLGTILFEKLGLKGGKKTKTGYSTAKEVLDKLQAKHPIIGLIQDYRIYAKLKSTYTEGLQPWINQKTGKIHCYLEQIVAATGRISSHNPNLQNIPMRYEMGRELRKAFVPSSPDYILISADYSQIELRLLAHLSGDENMIRAYQEGVDIHRLSASKILHKPLELISPEDRNSAKAINFGLIYGMGEFSLASNLGISLKEAKKYIENYFAAYPTIKDYLEASKAYATEHGYIKTMFGRVRPIPEIMSKNFNMRAYGERIAMNTPIQGTSADLIKMAMIELAGDMEAMDLRSRLILQIHDELIIDCHRDEIELISDLLKKRMGGVCELKVDLDVNVSMGSNWYEAK